MAAPNPRCTGLDASGGPCPCELSKADLKEAGIQVLGTCTGGPGTCGHPYGNHPNASHLPGDGRIQLPDNDPFAQYWEALKVAGTDPQPINLPAVGAAPAVVAGHRITLPANVFIFGQEGNRDVYYRRRCYPRIIQLIRSWFAKVGGAHGGREVILSGNPGGGKTTMGGDLLHEFQRNGDTIVYENQELKHRWLCPPNGSIFVGDLNCFNTELNQIVNRVVYICDCGKESYVNPLTCNAWTIVLSSPNRKHYEGWLNPQAGRAILRMFLPVWSLEEVQAVTQAPNPIYAARQAAQRDSNGEKVLDAAGNEVMVDLHSQRFTIHGGNARFIFSLDEDDVVMDTLKSKINSCNLKNVISTASTELKSVLPEEDVTWRLLRIHVEEMDAAGHPSYQKVKLDFASDHILNRLVSRKEKEHQSELVSLLTESGEVAASDTSSLRGKVFERYAINVMSSGGIFRARWLNDPMLTDMWIQFPATQQQGILNTLQNLQIGQFARPHKPNFATIDAAIRTATLVHLLQMTISKTHTINLLGLFNAMNQLNVINAAFVLHYFVVPPDVYPVFANPTPVAADAHNNLPNNIHMIVLEIPWPEQVGHKRKAPSAAATVDADALHPPVPVVITCDCSSGVQCCTAIAPKKVTRHCPCFKAGNKCGVNCHQAAMPAAAAMPVCRNV